MPTYQFKCKKEDCSEVKEVRQKYEDPYPKCDKCGSDTTKMISRTSFILKGNGWFNKGGY